MVRTLALLLSLCPLFVTELARAEPRDPAAAEVLFEAGRERLEARDYLSACAKFAESYRLDPAVGTLLNWATCEEHLGKTASAWQHLKEATSAMSPRDDRLPFALARLRELEARLPWLTLELEGAVPGAKVLRDGIVLEAASLGIALPVDPGEHTIVVRAPGHADQEFTVRLEEREKKELAVRVGPLLPKVPSKSETKPPVLGWSLVGAGTAGLGLGIATAMMLESEQKTVEEHCRNKRCDEAGVQAAARGKRLVWANAIAFGAGATALGTGIALILTSGKERERPVVSKVTATAQKHGAFVSYGGSF